MKIHDFTISIQFNGDDKCEVLNICPNKISFKTVSRFICDTILYSVQNNQGVNISIMPGITCLGPVKPKKKIRKKK